MPAAAAGIIRKGEGKNRKKLHGQMSEAFVTAAFLSLSGGLQDAYTYLFRGNVFANAQTGNIVLFSQCIAAGKWSGAVDYLVPLLAFVFGVAAAEIIRRHYQKIVSFHWRQRVLLIEILLLFVVGFLPQSVNPLANAMVSFSCAMQVQAFRKVNSYEFASTMCIGNMRSGMEALWTYIKTHEPEEKRKALRYLEIIGLFAAGAGGGSALLAVLHVHTIWVSCALLMVSLCLMFIKDEIAEHPRIRQEYGRLCNCTK